MLLPREALERIRRATEDKELTAKAAARAKAVELQSKEDGLASISLSLRQWQKNFLQCKPRKTLPAAERAPISRPSTRSSKRRGGKPPRAGDQVEDSKD